MIKNFKPRLYQETIFATASQKNTLVVLPTGLGKTNIFLMLAAHRLKQYPNSKIILIGPTRPLIDQYKKVFIKYFDLPEEKLSVLTGMVKPEKRQELYKSSTIIFSTPQGLENDIITNRVDLKDVSLLGVDEAHRAVGDYAYVFIAKRYNELAKYPRIIAMTASPGSETEKINEVIDNLFIEEIEVRTDKSPDVSEYMQDLEIKWVKVEFPEEFKNIQKYLQDCLKSKTKEMKELGYAGNVNPLIKRDLLGLQASLQGEIAAGVREYELLKSISLAAEALKVQHAVELLETQGIEPLKKYLDQIEQRAKTTSVKAVQNLMKDVNFRSAIIKTNSLYEEGIDHPKLDALKQLVGDKVKSGQKMIIFSQYRDSGSKIVEELSKLDGAKPMLFVGQAKKNGSGLSQKKQIEMLDDFRSGAFNILVSSSVGEEGLDIPQVDSVIFYEPIPSAIRHIQRRGRTARLKEGAVEILMTKGTRDEAYRWTAHHKEKRMYRTLEQMKKSIVYKKKENKTLDSYVKKVNIIADHREKGSGVIKELIELGANLKLEQLESADYLCSAACGVEFKRVDDFVNSLVDGRLLAQVKDLKQNFPKPLIIVEGEQDIYSVRNIHPNAIRGLIATITVSFQMPIIFTRNFKETAQMLLMIAKREQEDYKEFSAHALKKPLSLKEQQEFVISSLPGVGPTLSRPLLEKFGSIKAVMNASLDDLKKVKLIGDKKAGTIREVIDKDYAQ